eukprot:m.1351229 g.1351229  ORF g.1351229 m.1351229 type:complete len:853 (+) comp24923_c0_seq5:205-2763(+)
MNNNTAARRPDEEKSEDYIVGSIEVADVMNPEKQVVSLTTAHKEDESNNVITSVESASQSPVDVSSHVISAGFVCPLEMKMSEGPVDSTNDSTMSHPTSDIDSETTTESSAGRTSGRVRTPSAVIREQEYTQHDDSRQSPLDKQLNDGRSPTVKRAADGIHSTFCSFLGCRDRDDTVNLLTCHLCGNSGHQRCLQFGDALWQTCTSAPTWECIECKKCVVCDAAGNDDVLQFCDGCDCGVHLYCIEPPTYAVPEEDFMCHRCTTSSDFPKVSRTTQDILDFAAEYNRQNPDLPDFVPDGAAASVAAADMAASPRKSKPTASKHVRKPKAPKRGGRRAQKSPSKSAAGARGQNRKQSTTRKTTERARGNGSNSNKRPNGRGRGRAAAACGTETLTLVDPISVHPPKRPGPKSTARRLSAPGAAVLRVSATSRKTLDGGDTEHTSRGSAHKKRRTSKESSKASGPKRSYTHRGTKLTLSARRRRRGDDDDNTDMGDATPGHRRYAGKKQNGTVSNARVRGGTKVVLSPAKPRKYGEPTAEDERLYQQAVANAAASAPAPTTPAADREKRWVVLGDYEIQAWFSAPYPKEYAVLPKLYLCEFCLKYMTSEDARCRHRDKCDMDGHPPGVEIYRSSELQVWEVEGAANKVYCQNLCLLSKLFLDSKTLYYDVETFVFYVVTVRDKYGAHFLGYFSKDKDSMLDYNLSCIMTLPRVQRCGYGRFLIAFSYLLSRREKKSGTPEKPLSPLGVQAYRSYWRSAVLDVFATAMDTDTDVAISIDDISAATGMTTSDVEATLLDLGFISMFEEQPVLVVDPAVVRAHVVKTNRIQHTQNKHLILDPSKLEWKPHAERVDWI